MASPPDLAGLTGISEPRWEETQIENGQYHSEDAVIEAALKRFCDSRG